MILRSAYCHRTLRQLVVIVLSIQMVIPNVFIEKAFAHPLPDPQICTPEDELPNSQPPTPPDNSTGNEHAPSNGGFFGGQRTQTRPMFGQEFRGDDDIGGQGWGGEGSGLGAPGPAGIGSGGGTNAGSNSGASGGMIISRTLLRIALTGIVLAVSSQVGGCSSCGPDGGSSPGGECCPPGNCPPPSGEDPYVPPRPNPSPPPTPPPPRPPAPPATRDPVDLLHGVATEVAIDLEIPGPMGNWRMVRSYSGSPAALNKSTTQGVGWMNNRTDMYLTFKACDENPPKIVVLHESSGSIIRFTKIGSGLNYSSSILTNYKLVAVEATSAPVTYQYELTDKQSGEVRIFNAAGRLIEDTTVWLREAGRSGFTFAGDDTTVRTDFITSPQGQEYQIVLGYNSEDRLTGVEVRKYSGPYIYTVLQSVQYTYFNYLFDEVPGAHSSDLGSVGALVQVKVTRLTSDGTDINDPSHTVSRYTQYRYEGHRLKAIFNHDGIFSLLADNSNLEEPEDILQVGDTYVDGGSQQVLAFADRVYEYYQDNVPLDATETVFGTIDLPAEYIGPGAYPGLGYEEVDEYHRVKRGIDRPSGCSSCGGANGGVKYDYYYLSTNTHGVSSGYNDVVWVVIEDVSDANNNPIKRHIWALNKYGNSLREMTIQDPHDSPKYWCSSQTLNSYGYITSHRLNSAHTTVTTAAQARAFLDPSTGSNDASTLNDSTSGGLIWHYEYDSNNRLFKTLVSNGKVSAQNPAHYVSHIIYSGGGPTIDLPWRIYSYPEKIPSSADPTSGGVYTEYQYEFWGEENYPYRIKQRTIKPPIIPTTHNGSGEQTYQYEFYDEVGRLRWTKNGEGYVTYRSYDPEQGYLSFQMRDVDTSSLGSEITQGNSSGDTSTPQWEPWTGGVPTALQRNAGLPPALKYVTKNAFDDLARVVRRVFPDESSTYLKYEKYKTIIFRSVDENGVPWEPVIVTKWNDAHRNTEVYAVDAAKTVITGNKPTGIDDGNQTDFVAWTRNSYDPVSGALRWVDSYHKIPGSGTGATTPGTNYYRTYFLHTPMGLRGAIVQYVESSKYQVSAVLYDMHDRPVEIRRGIAETDPFNDPANPTDDYYEYDDLVQVSGNSIVVPSGFDGYARLATTEYDGGGVGVGYVTSDKRFYGTGTNDFIQTIYYRTYRGHLRGTTKKNGTTSFGPYFVQDIDWKGRGTASAQYTSTSWTSSILVNDGYTDYTTNSSDRFNWRITSYNPWGQTYRTKSYPGSEGTKHFESNNFYDRNGRLVCMGDKHSTHSEVAYDGVGRTYQWRVTLNVSGSTPYDTDERFIYVAPGPHPDLTEMPGTGDGGLIEFTHSQLDKSGNAIAEHTFELNHMDTNGIDIDATNSYVRSSTYNWYDDASHVSTSAYWGAGDGSGSTAGSWQYTALPGSFPSEPANSTPAILVTKYAYDAGGRPNLVTDPAGKQTKTFYDDLGRPLAVAENYVNFVPPTTDIGGGSNDEEDRVTTWEYNGLGQTTKLTAHNASTPQVTDYFYLNEFNASLLTHAIYPDATSRTPETNFATAADQVRTKYHLDGSVDQQKDQRGVVHTYSYNDRRQLTLDAATTIPSNTYGGNSESDAVRAIGRSYDNRGRISKITSYNGTTTSSTELNEVEYIYGSSTDDYGQVFKVLQEHDGATDISTRYVVYWVDYAISGGAFANGLRQQFMIYPSAKVVTYDYGSGIGERLNRIAEIQVGAASPGTAVANYQYNGTGRMVKVDYVGPDVRREMFNSTTNTDYDAWDRFGRTIRQQWIDYTSGTTTLDRIEYGYDYAGNRKWREDFQAAANSKDFDEYYTYDSLHRLKAFDRGNLTGTAPNYMGIAGTPANEQDWTLDQLGNWTNFVQKTAGTTNINQTRAHNSVNEIDVDNNHANAAGASIAGSPNWVDPLYDAAGNMTEMPSLNISQKIQARYDAWNRMVAVYLPILSTTNPVARNEYDGLNRRIVRQTDPGADGTVDETRHYYYSEQWQVIEEGVGSDPNAARADVEYVWGPQYVDDLLVRYRDADANGSYSSPSLEEELYSLVDANWNVTAVTNNIGAVQERFTYTPYGISTVLDASFAPKSGNNSTIAWNYRYTTREYDPNMYAHLQLNRNRWYHQPLGRWTSRDPIGYEGGTNLYTYIGGDPILFTDPQGLYPYPGVNVPAFLVPKNWREMPIRSPSEGCPDCTDCVQRILQTPEFRVKYKELTNQCVQYQTQLLEYFWSQEWFNECVRRKCFSIKPVCWWYPGNGVPGADWALSHCAVEVKTCGGKTIYYDNGWWGGGDGEFGPGEVPPYAFPY